MTDVIERFLRYVKIDTQSSEKSGTSPSTDKQFDLAKLLVSELKGMGIADVIFDQEHCYVYGKIPANSSKFKDRPRLGFIAHMDTSPECSDADVKPAIIQNYDGGDILLNKKQNIVMGIESFPELKEYVGKDLIVTDGTTLLGADDKAGVAEIMSLAKFIMENPDIEHGEIRIAFTPDEEIGQGTDYFDMETFDAEFAYTVDGGSLGEIEYENFNAADANVTVTGRSVHPGDAKDKMINSMLLAMEYNALLPIDEIPAKTSGYEGFYHLTEIDGSIEKTTLNYIIRDHSREIFEKRKEVMLKAATTINSKYGAEYVTVDVEDSYYNMKEKIEPCMHLIDDAVKAMKDAGVTPKIVPIRGGTDGARLSYEGLPCPNLSTGGRNYHGRFEYSCIQDMEKMVEVLKNLVY